MLLQYPVDYIGITGYFTSSHHGLDLGWNKYQGEPIYAAGDGTVVEIRNDCNANYTSGSSYGNFVKISHGNGIYTVYAHLIYGSVKVRVGDIVKRGQIIGNMGNTGTSFGTHCHFEVIVNGTKVNPQDYVYKIQGQTEKSTNKYVRVYNPDSVKEGVSMVVNSNEGLWLLDGNGKKVECYPNGTNVTYLDNGYDKYGYHYFNVSVNGKVGYMAQSYLTEVKQTTEQPKPDNSSELNKKIDELNKKVESLNNEVSSLTKSLNDANNQIGAYKSKINDSETYQKDCDKQILDLKNDLLKTQNELNNYKSYKIFTCKNDGKYYVDLKNGDVLLKNNYIDK